MGKRLLWAVVLVGVGVGIGAVRTGVATVAAAVAEVDGLRQDLQAERRKVRLLTKVVGDIANARPCLFWADKCPEVEPVTEADL